MVDDLILFLRMVDDLIFILRIIYDLILLLLLFLLSRSLHLLDLFEILIALPVCYDFLPFVKLLLCILLKDLIASVLEEKLPYGPDGDRLGPLLKLGDLRANLSQGFFAFLDHDLIPVKLRHNTLGKNILK